jgi:hypothetical protein
MSRFGLKPSPDTDKRTLLRRAALDLTGIPPTPDEMKVFVADTRPDAYARQVDRLLASPNYGEHWARVWMDLARYADSKGYEKDLGRSIWRWRDWVTDAYNADIPYDRFSMLQLAGDLLPDASEEDKIATAFHRNTPTNDEGGTDGAPFNRRNWYDATVGGGSEFLHEVADGDRRRGGRLIRGGRRDLLDVCRSFGLRLGGGLRNRLWGLLGLGAPCHEQGCDHGRSHDRKELMRLAGHAG